MTDVGRGFADEVADLHRFFEDWFRGRGERAIDEFSDRLDAGFTIVGPTGLKHDKAQIVRAVEERAGSYDVAIATTQVILDHAVPLLIGTYLEHQEFKGETTHRIATVTMAADESTPTGYRWLNVHETWIESNG